MERKGLCVSCASDKRCSFSRRFPVLECEEFDNTQPCEKKEKCVLKKAGR